MALLALLTLAGATARAQTALDAEELRRKAQSEAEARLRQQQAPDVRLPRPAPAVDPEALDLPEETPCFPIRHLQLDGERLPAFAWMQPWLDRYAGRCLGRAGIELLLRRLSAKIIGDGYITTRVGLPEQELATGTLRLELIPGRIRAIRFADPALDASWRSALPARPGDLLNLRDIEQGLEQLKRIPSQDADIDIAPGDAPGESDLVITLKRGKAWRLGLSADDSGTAASGRRQGSLSLSLDNPLNLNDLFSVTLNSDLWNDPHAQGTSGHALNYSLPWGHWTFQLADNAWKYRQTIQGVNQTFLSSGDSETQELRVQRLLQRGQFSKTSLQFRTQVRIQRSAIEHVEIPTLHQRTAAAELGLIHRHYVGEGQLDHTVAYREGVPWFGGLDDAPGLPAGSATRRYRLETLDAALLLPFKLGEQTLRWNSALRLQQTRDTLYTVDYLSIGNRYTVRGFDGERTLAAERGGYWRNDLEVPLGASGQSLYVGLDHGRVDGPGASVLAGRQLTGTALGLRGGAQGSVNFSYDIFAGWALQKPAGFVTSRPALGFQISFQY
jgi:hemolysin activation/secretion protein